jgi:hypothetical protein
LSAKLQASCIEGNCTLQTVTVTRTGLSSYVQNPELEEARGLWGCHNGDACQANNQTPVAMKLQELIMSLANHSLPVSSQTWEINQRRKPQQKGLTTGLLPQYALMLDKSCPALRTVHKQYWGLRPPEPRLGRSDVNTAQLCTCT